MTDNDDVLMQLKTALQAEPSREFSAGVRARVSHSHAQTRRMWWGLAAAATVTLATVALWRPAVEEPAAEAVVSARATVPTPPASTPEPSAMQERVVANATAPTLVRRATRVVSAAPDLPSEPRLEVLTNQPAVLRQLWARVDAGSAVEVAVEIAVPVPALEMKPIAPIVVQKIVVPPIVMAEIDKSPGREGAAPMVRRVDSTKEAR